MQSVQPSQAKGWFSAIQGAIDWWLRDDDPEDMVLDIDLTLLESQPSIYWRDDWATRPGVRGRTV